MGTGGGNTPVVLTWDARGNGNGRTVCTIVGEHQNRVTDYTAIVVTSTTKTAMTSTMRKP